MFERLASSGDRFGELIRSGGDVVGVLTLATILGVVAIVGIRYWRGRDDDTDPDDWDEWDDDEFDAGDDASPEAQGLP